MSEQGVTFTESAAERIAKAVKRVEQTPRTGGGSLPGQAPFEAVFWARITGMVVEAYDVGQKPLPKYSWIAVEAYSKSPTGFRDTEPRVYGAENARETGGSLNVERGTVVKMTYIGEDENNEPLYVFAYGGGGQSDAYLPPHDHRDNMPGNGGFAFSVYHPGTGLPQQPWAI